MKVSAGRKQGAHQGDESCALPMRVETPGRS